MLAATHTQSKQTERAKQTKQTERSKVISGCPAALSPQPALHAADASSRQQDGDRLRLFLQEQGGYPFLLLLLLVARPHQSSQLTSIRASQDGIVNFWRFWRFSFSTIQSAADRCVVILYGCHSSYQS